MKNAGDFREDLEFQIPFSIFIQKKLKKSISILNTKLTYIVTVF